MMGSKIQGEGDYESARHYNDETKQFVDAKTKDGKQIKGSAAQATDKLSTAEEEALSHAKSGGQDKRDAALLSEMEKQHKRCGSVALVLPPAP
jgi:hypothetical protein